MLDLQQESTRCSSTSVYMHRFVYSISILSTHCAVLCEHCVLHADISMIIHGHGQHTVRCPACYKRVSDRIAYTPTVRNSKTYTEVISELREAITNAYSPFLRCTSIMDGKNQYPMARDVPICSVNLTFLLCKHLHGDEMFAFDANISPDAVVPDEYLLEMFVDKCRF